MAFQPLWVLDSKVFAVSLAILCYRLIRIRLWATYPLFVAYCFISLVAEIIPHPADPHWWRVEWYLIASVTMIARAGALAEVLWFALLECGPKERRTVLLGVTCANAAIFSMVAVASASWTPLHLFTVFRECVLLCMAITVVLIGVYLWSRGVVLAPNTSRHLIIFAALLVLVKCPVSLLDAETGLLPFIANGEILDWWAEIGHTACALAWTFALKSASMPFWFRPAASVKSLPTVP